MCSRDRNDTLQGTKAGLDGSSSSRKVHNCPYNGCDYSSTHFSSLRQHLAYIHDEGVRWFSCDLCDYKAKKNGTVRRHKADVHNIDVVWYPCSFSGCSYRAKQKSHMKRHVQVVHVQKKVDEWKFCSYCIFRTKSQKWLMRHTEQHRRENAEQSAISQSVDDAPAVDMVVGRRRKKKAPKAANLKNMPMSKILDTDEPVSRVMLDADEGGATPDDVHTAAMRAMGMGSMSGMMSANPDFDDDALLYGQSPQVSKLKYHQLHYPRMGMAAPRHPSYDIGMGRIRQPQMIPPGSTGTTQRHMASAYPIHSQYMPTSRQMPFVHPYPYDVTHGSIMMGTMPPMVPEGQAMLPHQMPVVAGPGRAGIGGESPPHRQALYPDCA